jgi:hypothetical protein
VELWVNGGRSTLHGDHLAAQLHLYGQKYTFALRALNGADIAQEIPYKLSFVLYSVADHCAAAGSATYTEAADGASNRGNDVYTVGTSVPYTAAYTAAEDTAEASGIVVNGVSGSVRIDGAAANVAKAGAYYDGDAYALRTGAGAQQVTIRGDWASFADLDVWLFKAGSTTQVGWGLGSVQNLDYLTAAVEPNTDYQIFVASSDSGPVPYAVTICSEKFDIRGK